MKNLIDNIVKKIEDSLKRFGNFYLNAMNSYGEAINNSRGLVGA